MEFFMRHIQTCLLTFLLVGITACEQQMDEESQQRRQTKKYSQETLDKIERDVNEAMKQSRDRIDSTLDQTRY